MRIVGNDTNRTRQTQLVASGTLPNGKPVIVNSDGTVSVVAETSVSDSVGTPGVFTTSNLDSSGSENSTVASAYDVNADRIVVCYKLTSGNKYGYAVVGQVDSSNNSISFGTPTVFNSAESPYPAPVYDASNQKIVIGFADYGNSQRPYAIVATVDNSDNSISFGTKAQITTGAWNDASGAYDSANQKVVFTWTHYPSVSSSVGTVSGTSISFGTTNTFFTSSGSNFPLRAFVAYESSSGKIVSVFTDVGDDFEGQAAVGTVSGTSISYGTPAIYTTGASDNHVVGIGNNKVIIGYTNTASSRRAEAIIGTISGTSISYGSAVNVTGTDRADSVSIGFDSNLGKAVIAYRDNPNSGHGKLNVLSISGTTITAGSDITFEDSDIHTDLGTTTTFDSTNNRIVISYPNDGDSGKGKSAVFTVGGSIPNLTSENYIGISQSTAADGIGLNIGIKGFIDDNQSSLTAGQSYFVQTDGTLNTTADDPSVFAGTAVSATKLIVKG
jgi:hypothetical protein